MQRTIRPAYPGDEADIARVSVTTWRATYGGIMPEAVLDGLSEDRRAESYGRLLAEDGERCWYVAERAGRIVGFVHAGPERSGDPDYTGEIYALYVLPPEQGQGTGRDLMRAAVRCLADRGHTSLLIWVATRNPARGFYAAMGGRPARTATLETSGADVQDDPITVEETAYVWESLDGLLDGSNTPPARP